jgi:zinc transport system permease protein
VLVAAELDTAPGATIVIVALVVFLALTAAGALRRTKRAPVSAEPPDVVLHG